MQTKRPLKVGSGILMIITYAPRDVFLGPHGYSKYTLKRNSPRNCTSSSKPAIQLHKDSSKLTEMKTYSRMS